MTLVHEYRYPPVSATLYPSSSRKDLKWGVIVTTTGFQEIKPYSIYPTTNHPKDYLFNITKGRVLDEYQLVYISKGQGALKTNSTTTSHLTEGTLFMLFPGEWHTYQPDIKTGWNTYWVGFKGPQIDLLCRNNFFTKTNPFFKIGFNEEIVALFRSIISLAKKEEPGFQPLMGSLVINILGSVYKLKQQEPFEDKIIISKINKAKIIMREHVSGSITPEQIASTLNISYSWFRRMFKQYTGMAPAQYINQLKTQKAKEMLQQTNYSIKEIAASLQFESAYYFSVFFKRQTGNTPSEFRKMYRGFC